MPAQRGVHCSVLYCSIYILQPTGARGIISRTRPDFVVSALSSSLSHAHTRHGVRCMVMPFTRTCMWIGSVTASSCCHCAMAVSLLAEGGTPTDWQPKVWALGGRRWSCTGCKAPGYCMLPICLQPRPCMSCAFMFPFFLFTGRGVYHLQNVILCFVDVLFTCAGAQPGRQTVGQEVVSCVVNLACLGLQPSFGACVSSHFACWSDICAHVCYVCCSPGNRTWRLMETVCFVERGCLQSMQP